MVVVLCLLVLLGQQNDSAKFKPPVEVKRHPKLLESSLRVQLASLQTWTKTDKRINISIDLGLIEKFSQLIFHAGIAGLQLQYHFSVYHNVLT